MKLRVFHAADGDCLLLSSSDGRHALVDGGRAGTFQTHAWPTLQRMAKERTPVDLLVVSHIDADHISGILWLLEAVAAWAVFDHQTTDGGNPSFPRPRVPRPPVIKKIWHNSWRAQLGDLSGPIEALASRVGAVAVGDGSSGAAAGAGDETVLDALRMLAESIPQGVELRRIIDEETPIPRNDPFDDLVLLRKPPHVEKLGKARLTVIGPAKKHLERLRQDWREWLAATGAGDDDGGAETAGPDPATAFDAARARDEGLVQSIVAAAKTIAVTDPTKVTPPNRASITLLAEEAGRACLLTGDAAEEELLEGLEAAGRIVDGHARVEVVKVQHHGSEFNLSQQFASTVIGDVYVFCADGAHHNPDPLVVKTLVETRLAEDPSPFTVWFNSSPEAVAASRRKALRAAIREATKAADRNAAVKVRVLADDKHHFDLTV